MPLSSKIPPTKCLILAFIHFADCNHWCRSKGSITSSGQVTNEHDCSNSNITHNWKCIPTTTTKLYVYFLFHLSCYPSLTQTTKCSKIPTLKVRESFGNHYVLVYFNLTRAPGSFLVISALKGRSTFDFQLSARAMQNLPFIYNVEKISAVRIHLPNRYL